jgi:hypothetical protein
MNCHSLTGMRPVRTSTEPAVLADVDASFLLACARALVRSGVSARAARVSLGRSGGSRG